MGDIYVTIAEQPDEVIAAIAASLEARAAEDEMQQICAAYMAPLAMGGRGRLLEVGCGGGAATRTILRHLEPAEMVGVDPSPGLVAHGQAALADEARVTLRVGDAVATDEADASVDMVIAHTVYSHLTDPEAALREAHRVLKPGGRLVVFDGDYANNSVALYPGDPLQSALEAIARNLIHGPFVMRRMPRMMRAAGFRPGRSCPHGYVQTGRSEYLLSLISRGMDAAARAGEFGPELAQAFRAEAEARMRDGRFYGSILFVSIVAEKV